MSTRLLQKRKKIPPILSGGAFLSYGIVLWCLTNGNAYLTLTVRIAVLVSL